MAYTFMAAKGQSVGKSLIEKNRFNDAKEILHAARDAGRKVLLPTDHMIAASVSPFTETEIVTNIPQSGIAVDIGPETSATYAREAANAATIFWNGPMGIFEIPIFATGTCELANAVARSSGQSIVGGGDSLAAVNGIGVGTEISHLSTGGGASLEYIQGITLPGVASLE
jgi:phosphoglycerate kinase